MVPMLFQEKQPLRHVSRGIQTDMEASDRQLTGVKRSTDETTKALRGDLGKDRFTMSPMVKSILNGRRWGVTMLTLEGFFVFGWFLLMIVWTPALGFFPVAIAIIAIVWAVAELGDTLFKRCQQRYRK